LSVVEKPWNTVWMVDLVSTTLNQQGFVFGP
jgi:hypothetical protein